MSSKHAREAVILSGARTPQGKFLGALSGMSAAEIGRTAFQAAVERSRVKAGDISEVIVGNVVSAGVGQALPRQISLKIGVPDYVGGITVNKICGSSLKAVMLAANAIKAEDGDVYLAGGVESMSRAPYLNDALRTGHKYGEVTLRDALKTDGLWCSLCDWGMGNAAEFIGRQLEITRDEMDAFAARSHELAAQAADNGKFKDELVPVVIKGRKGDMVIDSDEPIRRDTSIEALAKLAPAFEKAAVVAASRAYAEKHGHKPLARIAGYGQAAVDPAWMFYAPVKAIPIALARAGWTVNDVDLFEINEAFAAQVLADLEGMKREGNGIPMEKVNVHGGAIALGHPLGASGARVLVTLIHTLQDRGLKRGVAALCLGGGEAVAMAVELE
jgi:acetyl-CoA C-acetyltransferase